MVDQLAAESDARLSLTDKICLGLILALSFCYRWAHFWYPSRRDEGNYGLIAQDVLRGYLPLESLVGVKGVLLYLDLAGPLSIFGAESMAGIRLFAATFVCGSILVFFALARQLFGSRVALWSAFFFSLPLSSLSLDAHQCGSEIFATLPSLLCLAFVWRGYERQTHSDFFWSGIFFALTIWTRSTFFLFGLLFLVFLFTFEKGKRKLKTFLLGVAGTLLMSSVFLLVYYLKGELETLYLTMYSFLVAWGTAGEYLAQPGSVDLKRTMWALFEHSALLFLLSPLAWKPLRQDKDKATFVLLWLFVGLAAFLSAGIYLQKQVLQFVPPLALLAGLGAEFCLRSNRTLKGVFLLSLALSLVPMLGSEWKKSRGGPSEIFLQSKALGHWIKENTEPHETLYNWGLEWQVYFHAHRRSASRQVNLQFIIASAVSAELGVPFFVEQMPKIENELMNDLENEGPKFLLVTAKVDNYGLKSFTLPKRFEALLEREYEFLFSEEPFYVFIRKGSTPLKTAPPLPLSGQNAQDLEQQ